MKNRNWEDCTSILHERKEKEEEEEAIEEEISSYQGTPSHTLQRHQADNDEIVEYPSIKMTLETFLCNWKLNMTIENKTELDLEPIPGIFEKNEINNRLLLREIRMAKSDTPCGTIIPLSLCPPLEGQSHSSWLKLKLKLKLKLMKSVHFS